jgi:general secretion pathway protein K
MISRLPNKCRGISRWSQASSAGIALVVVLWAIVLLSSMAVAISAIQRTDIDLIVNLLDSARARAQAQAGIYYAASRVGVATLDGDLWEADGSAHDWQFDGVSMRLRIADERSRIDLNRASPLLLEGLLRAVGIDEALAPALRDAIIDWRDKDNMRQLDGAEDDDYADLDMAYGAKDDDFASVDELQLVMGVTPEIFNALAPHLTVYSGSSDVAPLAASREVLYALPGVSEEAVEAYLAEREALLAENLPLSTLSALPASNTVSGRVSVVRIVCEVYPKDKKNAFSWGAIVDTASGIGPKAPEVLAWLTRIQPGEASDE